MAKVIISDDTTPQIPQSTIEDSINKTFEDQDEQTNMNTDRLVSTTKSKPHMHQPFLSQNIQFESPKFKQPNK